MHRYVDKHVGSRESRDQCATMHVAERQGPPVFAVLAKAILPTDFSEGVGGEITVLLASDIHEAPHHMHLEH